MLNEVILIGRLGNDPEITETKKGTKVATISLPLFHTYTQEGRKTEWVQCRAFGKLASIIEMAKKGVLVTVKGELHSPTWEAEDGSRRNRTYVVIESFRFLEKKREGEEVLGTVSVNEKFEVGNVVDTNANFDANSNFDEDIDGFLNNF